MLPTPAKFHYIFNLRDLSRIWQGILYCISEVVSNEQSLMSLWKHECMRVISDRFTNQSDKDWFEKTMKRVAAEELGEELQAMIEDTPYLVDFLRFVRADCYEFQEWTTNMMPRFRNFTVIITRLLCFFFPYHLGTPLRLLEMNQKMQISKHQKFTNWYSMK